MMGMAIKRFGGRNTSWKMVLSSIVKWPMFYVNMTGISTAVGYVVKVYSYLGLGLGTILGGNVLSLATQALASTPCYRYDQEEIRS